MKFLILEQSWKMKDLEKTLMSCSLQVRNHQKLPFMLILYLLQYKLLYISFLLRYGWGGWCLRAYTSGIVPWSLWWTAGCHRHATESATGHLQSDEILISMVYYFCHSNSWILSRFCVPTIDPQPKPNTWRKLQEIWISFLG